MTWEVSGTCKNIGSIEDAIEDVVETFIPSIEYLDCPGKFMIVLELFGNTAFESDVFPAMCFTRTKFSIPLDSDNGFPSTQRMRACIKSKIQDCIA